MSAASNDEGGPREDRPTSKTHANGFTPNLLFHALAPAIGVDAARHLADRLCRLQTLLEEEVIRLTVAVQAESPGRNDLLVQERAS